MTNDDTLGLARRVTEEIPASLADVRIDRVVSLVADVSRSAAAALIDAHISKRRRNLFGHAPRKTECV
ncbi:MAG: hypothetical protein EBY88_06105, partial [Actinobacteria bacterium]|nr:hypothetical protein [Actinomycetota bacterium]